MKYTDEQINSIGELISKLKMHIDDYDGPIWFRGQANDQWKLEPKLLRKDPIPSETHLINRFKQNAVFILDRVPKDDFGWLFLMQHYSMPTRLLDWTENPLVALYFAIISEETNPGALWVLSPTKLNEKSNFRPEYEHEVPSFEDFFLQNYLPETIAHESRSKLFPIAAIAPRNSARMQAQLGVFTISHRENIYIEDVGDAGSSKDYIWRYIISADVKKEIFKELNLLGYSKFALFPELSSLSEMIIGV